MSFFFQEESCCSALLKVKEGSDGTRILKVIYFIQELMGKSSESVPQPTWQILGDGIS